MSDRDVLTTWRVEVTAKSVIVTTTDGYRMTAATVTLPADFTIRHIAPQTWHHTRYVA